MGDRVSGPYPLKNQKKNIWFLSNIGPDPLKNHKATKPAFNVGPSSARQRNAISMAFRWWANDCPLTVVFESSVSSSTLTLYIIRYKKQSIYSIGMFHAPVETEFIVNV